MAKKKTTKKKTKPTTSTHPRHVAKRGALSRRVSDLENEFSSIMRALQTHTQPIVKHRTPNTYVATVSFLADRKLTAEEIDRLAFAISVQVEDPSGPGDEKRAEFSTAQVTTIIRRTRKSRRRGK